DRGVSNEAHFLDLYTLLERIGEAGLGFAFGAISHGSGLIGCLGLAGKAFPDQRTEIIFAACRITSRAGDSDDVVDAAGCDLATTGLQPFGATLLHCPPSAVS